jgi:hypothetical protein
MSPRKKKTRRNVERREIELDTLKTILERAAQGQLSKEDVEQLSAAVDTLAVLTRALEAEGATVARLRRLLFGSQSEKTKDVVGPRADGRGAGGPDEAGSSGNGDPPGAAEKPAEKKKRKGHGRNGAGAYTGAEKVVVPHQSLTHGGPCPACDKGTVYRQAEPAVLVRITGVAPLSAVVYERERLRCNLCGEVFTAASPPGLGTEKYDETAAAMIAMLKYGCGLPFNRIQRLGDDLGVPLPAATQWEVVAKAAEAGEPVWVELVHRAAQGDVMYIDDTHAKVLDLNAELLKQVADGNGDRTGVRTTGVMATTDQRKVALFFTGANHAGENIAEVLARRSQDLDAPILMCDALSSNTSTDFKAIVANCLAHGRRHFVDVVSSFPDEVRHVLDVLGKVYLNDAETRTQMMSAEQRLLFHQQHSGPLMDGLEKWLQQQLDERLVEPSSTLGGAITYMQNHWDKLTLFLRQRGAPLDNNVAERMLKRAILHRKNSLFYKTENGAHVGDVFMSLIHTAELAGANPFHYLVALQRHSNEVTQAPGDWLPWAYQDTLLRLEPPSAPQP